MTNISWNEEVLFQSWSTWRDLKTFQIKILHIINHCGYNRASWIFGSSKKACVDVEYHVVTRAEGYKDLSFYIRLKRVLAWILLIIRNLQARKERIQLQRVQTFQLEEHQEAEPIILRQSQSRWLSKAVSHLTSKDTLLNSSALLPLRPFSDKKGLRSPSGGRESS